MRVAQVLELLTVLLIIPVCGRADADTSGSSAALREGPLKELQGRWTSVPEEVMPSSAAALFTGYVEFVLDGDRLTARNEGGTLITLTVAHEGDKLVHDRQGPLPLLHPVSRSSQQSPERSVCPQQ
jgi:hypothetical protein